MSASVGCVVGLGRKGGGHPVVVHFMTLDKETGIVKMLEIWLEPCFGYKKIFRWR
jgi:hypothetical protein